MIAAGVTVESWWGVVCVFGGSRVGGYSLRIFAKRDPGW